MGKDPQITAQKELDKAELHYHAAQYKKAGKYFVSAGDQFFKLNEYKIARECFSFAAKSFDYLNSNYLAMEAMRNAGDSSLFINDFSNSNKFYKQALKFVPSLRRDNDYYYILFSSLSFLCLFLEGKQAQGLTFLKEIRKNVDNNYFKESPLIALVKDLLISIRDKNDQYLKKIEKEFGQYDFSEGEKKLLKIDLALAKVLNSLKTKLILDRDQYTTRDIINLTINLDTSPIIDVSKYSFYNYEFKKLTISNIVTSFSDNITAQKKPVLPLTLKPGEKCDFKFALKPHFQVEKPFIGPIILTCEFNDNLIVYYEGPEIILPNIISPPPSLDISMENLRPPLIGQTFPLEFLIENKSEGDALELELNIEFPNELKVMRGTTKKQIYSLSSNDTISWELSLRPSEAGDYTIKMDLKFKDPDQNQIEETKNFPFSIKL